jgi:glycosyltransferase involved in cell wall biosynthesis
VNGILIDAELTREQMNGLLAVIDVYVSLHRAEGFGLGIAEAMFLGKPAVVTAYSGNLDFTDTSNSCLVGYRLRPIEETDHQLFPEAADTYAAGIPWAEPSVEQAARWMRFLYDCPEQRRRIGRVAAATIRTRYNREAVQRVLVRRLESIQKILRAHADRP